MQRPGPVQVQRPGESKPASIDDAARDYAAALDQLRGATLAANNVIDLVTIEALGQAITLVGRFPEQLRADPSGRQAVLMARLGRARGYLNPAVAQPERAEAAIDEAIRRTHDGGVQAAAEEFGEDMAALVAARRAVVEAETRHAIELVCELACEASIDGYPFEPGIHMLYAGAHLVHLRARDDSVPSQTRELSVDGQGARPVVILKRPWTPPPPRPRERPPVSGTFIPPPDYESPLLGRGLEIGGLVVGVAMVIGGVSWVAATPCSKIPGDCVYHQSAGATLAAVGAASGIMWTSLLIFDARRRRAPVPTFALGPGGVVRF